MSTSESRRIFTVYRGGTVKITDSTINGKVHIQGRAAVADNPDTTDKNEAADEFRTKAYIFGDTSIKTVSGLKVANAYADAYIDGSFTGEIELTGEAAQIKAGTGFESLESVKSITKAGTSGATFAYYDAETGKFGWTAAPVLEGATDSGKYEDGTGVIRFLTTFTTAPATAAVENYGTYAIGASNFTGDPESITKFVKFETALTKDGQAFIVDVVNIPAEKLNTNITAISFVKLKGIATPVYLNYDAVNVESAADGGVVKNLVKEA